MAGPVALDIEERQALIDYFDDDAGFYWHHRVLFLKGDGSRWVVGTPDGDVSSLDMGLHRIIPLERGERIPAAVVDQAYLFEPNAAVQLLPVMRRQAKAMADVLGFATPAVSSPDGVWVFADPGRRNFDQEVPLETVGSQARFIEKNAVGLALVGEEWCAVERVAMADRDQWRQLKQAGPGRDLRVAGHWKDGAGFRYVSIRDALGSYRQTVFNDWPHLGPRAIVEFLQSLERQGRDLTAYHEAWLRSSGSHAKSAAAREHAMLTELLRLQVSYDQLDVSNCASSEQLVRYLLALEVAVRRNPKNPDYEGLERMQSRPVDESGAAVVPKYTEYVAAQSAQDAKILKGSRQLREEREAANKEK